MSLSIRYRVYEPNGSLRGSLPFPSSQEFAAPLNDMPSLRLDYSQALPGIEYLYSPCEVAIEVRDPATGEYTEPPGLRFLNLRRAGDRLEDGGIFQFTMPSYGWQLRKVRNINFPAFDEEGRRNFNAVTPGEVLASLINEAKTRGNVPGLAIDFNGTQDSDGQSWDNVLTIAIDAGQDLWSILDAFTRQGLCDWRMNGRTLQVYNPDGFLNRNRITDPAVILRPYYDTQSEPNDITLEDLAKKALVQGDNNAFLEVTNSTAIEPWGQWEEYISQAGVSDSGTMELLARKMLEGRAAARTQLTRQIVFREGGPVPFIDYRPGDHILATDEDGNQRTDLRVTQITIASMGEDELQGAVTLNDRFMERDMRNQRAINSLTNNGGPGSGGGSGGTPQPPPNEDTRVPAAPQGLVVGSSTYIDATGQPVGQATATWTPVTTSTGGSAMDVDRYEVQSRLQTLPEGYETRTTVNHPQSTAFVSPLDVGATYLFRVRAIGANGRGGPFSTTVAVLIAADGDPTDPPSAPILSSRLGTIRVTWDGQDENGNSMPVDFSHVQVEMSDNGAGPWVEVGRIFMGGDAVIVTPDDPDAEYFFRLLSVDTSANISDPSEVASTFVNRISGPDIEANSITANEIAAGTITAEEIAAYSIRADRLAIGEARNLFADPNFTDTELSEWRAEVSNFPNSSTETEWTWNGTAMQVVLTSNLFLNNTTRFVPINSRYLDPNIASATPIDDINLAMPVDQQFGNVIGRYQINVSLSGGSWPTGATIGTNMVIRYYDRAGQPIGFSTVVPTATYSAPTGGFVTLQSAAGSPVPAGAVVCIPFIVVSFGDIDSGTNIVVQVASLFAAQANQEVMIENGSISANKIQANAITTTQLQADAITAKHTITGAVFQTSASGLRVYISPNANFLNQPGVFAVSGGGGARDMGFFMTDASGVVEWNPYTGLITGPEATRNGANRADLMLEVGGSFRLHKEIQSSSTGGTARRFTQLTGIQGADTTNELRLMGTLPRNAELGLGAGEVFRGISMGFGSGSWTWSQTEINNNTVIYRPLGQPRVSAASGGAGNPGYTSTYSITLTGFSFTSSGPVNRVDWLFFRGGTTS